MKRCQNPAMAIRTISNTLYRRNRAFWQRRQRRGDEIRVTRLQRIIAVFYGVRHMRFSR
ncbi:MAG TPA: hypothetical protein VNU64_12280 [Burkholderiales bacterium]|nr:hypothetical protein [Burkholderiales bacterium]